MLQHDSRDALRFAVLGLVTSFVVMCLAAFPLGHFLPVNTQRRFEMIPVPEVRTPMVLLFIGILFGVSGLVVGYVLADRKQSSEVALLRALLASALWATVAVGFAWLVGPMVSGATFNSHHRFDDRLHYHFPALLAVLLGPTMAFASGAFKEGLGRAAGTGPLLGTAATVAVNKVMSFIALFLGVGASINSGGFITDVSPSLQLFNLGLFLVSVVMGVSGALGSVLLGNVSTQADVSFGESISVPETVFHLVDDLGRIYSVGGSALKVGRSQDCDLSMPDDGAVSTYHAQLMVRNGVLEVSDLGSKNGTWVNEHAIQGPTPLSPGDVMVVGRNRLRVTKAEVR